MPEYAIVARIVAKEGRRPELMDGLRSVLAVTHQEPDTLMYVIHEATFDEVTAFVYELYTNEAAHETHRSSDAHVRHVANLDDLLACPPDVWSSRPLGAKGVPALD